MKEMWKSVLFKVLMMAGITGILVTASILAYKSTEPEELTLSEDGYYEINTVYEYESFWQMVANHQSFIKGRLMADIYLNDITEYEKWNMTPPIRWGKEVSLFTGEFDGNGHTIYGLYSDNGYGLVKKNSGTIHDLSIKNSLIAGNGDVGGICQKNMGTISGCEFGGTLVSSLTDDNKYSNMAGICIENKGTIERSGYTGTMPKKGIKAGICTDNNGEIYNCYNLTMDDIDREEELFFAIANKGEKGCFMRADLRWETYINGQVMSLDEAQVLNLSAFLDRDLYTVYQEEQKSQVGFRWSNLLKTNLGGNKIQDKKTGFDVTESLSNFKKQEALKNALTDEKISDLIWEILMYKGANWNSIRLEVIDEKKDALSAVLLSADDENVKLATYLPETGMENDYDNLWALCSGILEERNEETWEHYTWQVVDAENREESADTFVLYQTEKEAQGFFFIEDGMLYQVEMQGTPDGNNMQVLKEAIKNLVVEKEDEEDSEADAEAQEQRKDEMWEVMLWKLWEGRIPADALSWQDEIIRQAVYKEIGCNSDEIPSREEIIDLEYLQIWNADQVETFQDLSVMPNLTGLSMKGESGETVTIDFTGKTVPGLRELTINGVGIEDTEALEELPYLTTLYIINGKISDLSFVSKMPNLIDVSFYRNNIQDISPLADCKEIKVLSLAYNEIEDITPLSKLSKLEELGLQGNKVTDIEALRGLTSLKGVNLNENQITDLSPLTGMTQLTALGAVYNQITDVSPLKGMTQMDNLALDYNQIKNISALEGMTQMEYLGLSNNLIEDYTPIQGMEKLFSLSVAGNPGQNIGSLIFVPLLSMGGAISDVKEAQNYLELYYPGQEIEAEDITKGDLNGDGIEDLAITGLSELIEDEYYSDSRLIYPFLRQVDGSLVPLDTIETLGPGDGGIYGDPYQGLIITDQKMMLKVYGGSNWRWGFTSIFEYKNGQLEETWTIDISHFVFTGGCNLTVHDREKDLYQFYVIAGDIEENKETLLLEEGSEEYNLLGAEVNEKLRKITEMTIPEVYASDLSPEIGDGYYDYMIYSQLFQVSRTPDQVLTMAAEEFLEGSTALPVFIYSKDEIKENYTKLTGVEVPEVFYIGYEENEPRMLVYRGCEQTEEGNLIHKLEIEAPGKEYWNCDRIIYYDESAETFKENEK